MEFPIAYRLQAIASDTSLRAEPECRRSLALCHKSLSLSLCWGGGFSPPRPWPCDFLFGSLKRRCEFNYTRWISIRTQGTAAAAVSSLVWEEKISYEWEDTDGVFARSKRVYRSVYCYLFILNRGFLL
ncbi:hypothetical protein CEXT_12611 [Caerostris extrusa]|uniref:Uncharacterized protein n=1 Tax=Caerostris extrusa TaxID=172846 RepID=A0AAV4P8F5_CAEEX|nr:hypothetical protein CEXT_12611 [Caerostris extrusa]